MLSGERWPTILGPFCRATLPEAADCSRVRRAGRMYPVHARRISVSSMDRARIAGTGFPDKYPRVETNEPPLT